MSRNPLLLLLLLLLAACSAPAVTESTMEPLVPDVIPSTSTATTSTTSTVPSSTTVQTTTPAPTYRCELEINYLGNTYGTPEHLEAAMVAARCYAGSDSPYAHDWQAAAAGSGDDEWYAAVFNPLLVLEVGA